jgi:hypothetical protein
MSNSSCPCLDDLLDALARMVDQHCAEKDGSLFSGCIEANAEAIELLAKHGRIELTGIPYGRSVSGKWKDEK